MIICIYCANFSVFTTGYPMRGLILELIRLRKDDNFKLIFWTRNIPKPFASWYYALESLPNVEIVTQRYTKKLSQVKSMLGFKNYCTFRCKADVYVSTGVDYFGKEHHPIINILHDLSSIRVPKTCSLKWHGRLMMRNSIKLAVKYVNHICCVSKFTKTDLNNLYPQTIGKTSVLYNGIADEWFDDFYLDFEIIERKFQLPAEYWIWWGAITKRKNIEGLIKAYENLILDNKNIPSLVLIGNFAEEERKLKYYILNFLKEKVIILPHQDLYTLKTIVRHSSGLVFPSFYEGFGLPIIEAFSQGIPVLHSNVTAMPEIAGGLGISCDPYNIESIKNGLIALSRNKDDITTIEKRKAWAKNFTYRKAAESFTKIIDEVVCASKNSR